MGKFGQNQAKTEKYTNAIEQNSKNIIQELKKLRKKIRKATNTKQKSIQKLKSQKFIKYKPIDIEAISLMEEKIEKAMISSKEIKFFSEQQIQQLIAHNFIRNAHGEIIDRAELKALCQFGSDLELTQFTGIHQFWKIVILESDYSNTLTQFDMNLLSYLKNIQIFNEKEQNQRDQNSKTQRTTYKKKLCFSFKIKSGHPFIDPGNYIKGLYIDQEGNLVEYSGSSLSTTKMRRIKKGLFKILFSNTSQSKTLNFLFYFLQVLRQEIIPYSLEYYLKGKKNIQEKEISKDQQINSNQKNNQQDFQVGEKSTFLFKTQD